MTEVKFNPDWVIAPGETLAEWFEANHLPKSIAAHYGISERTLNRVLSGRQPIGPRLAQRLCNMTFIGAPFWLALEHNFRAGLAAGKTWVGK
jgi:plasmid maintenance system antidote protein VapI